MESPLSGEGFVCQRRRRESGALLHLQKPRGEAWPLCQGESRQCLLITFRWAAPFVGEGRSERPRGLRCVGSNGSAAAFQPGSLRQWLRLPKSTSLSPRQGRDYDTHQEGLWRD